MSHKQYLWALAATVVASWARLAVHAESPGPYGLSSRTLEPQMFAPGVVSTEDDEVGGTFNPEGTEFYFGKLGPYSTFPRLAVICVSRLRDGRWTPPEVVPFSGRDLDFPPHLSPDGRRMFFTSARPAPGQTARVFRIWSVDRAGDGWAEPVPLPATVNAPDRWNMDPSVSANGTLYFSSDREEPGRFQIYRSRFADGSYGPAEKLGAGVNSEYSESQPFISPDEKALVFVSTGTQGGPPPPSRAQSLDGAGAPYPRGDLYVSEADEGGWTPARHIEHGVNSIAEEGYPSLTPDGRYLFFVSQRSPFGLPMGHRMDHAEIERNLRSVLNGHGNVYYVSADVLGLHR